MTFLMRQSWVGLISLAAALAVAAAVIIALRRRHRRSRPDRDDALIANVDHAEASAVFRRLRRRYHSLIGVEVAALSVVGLAAVGLTMRPLSERIDEREVNNRDVMLCLDVSGSMIDLDAEILTSFATMAAGLDGERVGLTIFNGSAVSVFPLTDDADYIAATLAESAVQIVEHKQLFVEGTNEGGSSLIGDGLASCGLRFDRLDAERSRSIVFATDNMRAGSPIITVEEAGEMVRERGIRVYAILAEHTPEFAGIAMSDVATDSGGAAFQMTDERHVDAVIAEISALDTARMELPADVIADDRPTVWIVMCLVGVAGLVGSGWWLRR